MSSNPFSNNRVPFILGALVSVLVIGYALFVATPYLLGPSLTVISPKPYSTATDPLVEVSGTTNRVSYLSINDMPIPLAEDGSFKVVRSFPKGYTVLVVRVRDRFDRERTETVHFIHSFISNENYGI